MPSQLTIYDAMADASFTGTAGDDFILAFSGDAIISEELIGGDGDDYILADCSAGFATGTSASFVAPYNINDQFAWTLDENPFVANSTTIPHMSLYVLAGPVELLFSTVQVGAGETITIDIDFGTHPIGVDTDVRVTLFTPAGVAVASSDDSTVDRGAAGSVSGTDSFLTFTNTTGAAVDYIIQFSEAGAAFGAGESFVANVSVSGHIVAAATLMGADTLSGGAGDDTLAGQGGGDMLLGDSGNDTLIGGTGSDFLDGGDGIDGASYADSASAVRVDLGVSGPQDTLGAGVDWLTVENLTGSAFADTLTGNYGANSLVGILGNDILRGVAGNDNLIGGEGNDALDGGVGNDALNGGNGVDVAYYATATAAVRVNLGIAAAQDTLGAGLDTLTAIENVIGSNFNDTLIGNTGANALNGYGGNDVLYGGSGNDSLLGGEGNDALDGGLGNDVLNGGNGVDVASYAASATAVRVNLGVVAAQDTLGAGTDTLSAIENVSGSSFNDVLTGNTGANAINGNGGNDVVYGGSGNDVVLGGDGNDAIDGGLGNDVINGGNGTDVASYASATDVVRVNLGIAAEQNTFGAGIDTLSGIENLAGSNFNDSLTGSSAANVINGGGLHDSLNGRAGNDTLFGGAGQDSFMFDTSLNAATNVDTIGDFVAADDVILLATAVFTAIAPSILSAAAFQLGTAANDAGDRIVYDSATGRIYYDADGSGAGAQVLFARVTAGTALTNLDFIAPAPDAEAPKAGDVIGLGPRTDATEVTVFLHGGGPDPYQVLDYFFA